MLVVSAASAYAKPLLVGVSVPLSSNAAKLADQFVAGMEYAKASTGKDKDLELLIVDDGCDKDLGQLAAEDLAQSEAVLVTGYFCSEAASIAADILREKQIPMLINIARSERLVKDKQKENWLLWRIAQGDNYPADAAFEALSKRWRNVPYAIVDDGTIYGRTLIDEFRVRMEDAEIPPIYVDNFRAAQSTQAGLIRRLQKSGVKAAFVGAASDDIALIARNISDLGADIEVAGGEVLNILPFQVETDPTPQGLLAILEPEIENLPAGKKLSDELLSKGIEPEPYFIHGYAAMQLIISVLDQGIDNISNTLETQRFSTILGDVEFDEAGRNIHNRFSLHRWNGKLFLPADNALKAN